MLGNHGNTGEAAQLQSVQSGPVSPAAVPHSQTLWPQGSRGPQAAAGAVLRGSEGDQMETTDALLSVWFSEGLCHTILTYLTSGE